MLQPGTPKGPDNDENIVHSKFSEKYYLAIGWRQTVTRILKHK